MTPDVQLFGWDSRSESWHGPNQLAFTLCGSVRLLEALRAAPGSSWYGPVNCCTPRESGARLFAVVHDLRDCALAALYCDESRTGPVEILAALPAEHRAILRPEFAFEFVAYARFLGAISAGAELALHDLIAAGIVQSSASQSLVFSISTGLWASDLDHQLAHCAERVATGILQWVAEREPAAHAG